MKYSLGLLIASLLVFAVLAFKPTNSSIQSLPELKNGRWINQRDTFAGLEVKDSLIFLFYKSPQESYQDKYHFRVTTALPEYADTEKNPGTFLILEQPGTTLQFEILGYTDSTFSLLQFPNGWIHLFRPEKGKN